MSKYPTELAYSKGLLSHGDQITKYLGAKFLKFSRVLIIFFISVTKFLKNKRGYSWWNELGIFNSLLSSCKLEF